MIWNSGSWLVLRSSRSSVTNWSSGTAWSAKAFRAVRRVRSSSSAKVGSPDRSTRSGMVLTNMPISGSTAELVRPAEGLPMTRSFAPESRESSSAKADSVVMNGVTRCRREVAAICCHSSGPSSRLWASPSKPWTAGRVRLVGSSSTGGAPASRSRSRASAVRARSPRSSSRSRAAYSANCIGSGSSSASVPASWAEYSTESSWRKRPMDQPSLMVWWQITDSTWSWSSSRSSAVRISGPAARSNTYRASCSTSSQARAIRSASGVPLRSVTGSASSIAAAMCWWGSPSAIRKVVRRDSCRSTSCCSERCSAPVSRGPLSRSARTRL
jgi:hypothetical protein